MSSKLVLVLNCGSSSLKFAIIDPTTGDEYLTGLAECFNLPEARIKWKMDGAKHEAQLGVPSSRRRRWKRQRRVWKRSPRQ